MRRHRLPAFALLCLLTPCLAAQERKPTPTAAHLAYGPHERQVLDFWKANSEQPAPLVLYIHGGGWQGGDKSSLGAAAIQRYLDAGIAVAAINYRYVKQAAAANVEPPV